jgi:hypothetical protein
LAATRLILSMSHLARLLVIDLTDLGGALAAVEPIEREEPSPSPPATAVAICIAGASRPIAA